MSARIVYEGTYDGKLPRLNQKFGARAFGGKGRLFTTSEYKKGLEAIALSFAINRPDSPIDYPVDLQITVELWKMIDTDAPIKAIMDALEHAGVVKDDRLIRDVTVFRRYHKRDEIDRCMVELTVTGERER